MALAEALPGAASPGNDAPSPRADPSPPRHVICIGDIHGCHEKLERLWGALEAKLGPDEFGRAAVVFLGDYCDRGPDTKQVLDFLVALPGRYPSQQQTFLCGNHDHAFASFLCALPNDSDYDMKKTWEDFPTRGGETWWDGKDTNLIHRQGLRWGSYLYGSHSTFKSYGVPFPDREGLCSAVPQAHKDFLRSLVWCHDCPDPSRPDHVLLFVHAGLVDTISVEQQLEMLRKRDVTIPRVAQLSGRREVIRCPKELKGKYTLISGHHNRSYPNVIITDSKDRLIIDTCGGSTSAPLSAVLFDPQGWTIVTDGEAEAILETVNEDDLVQKCSHRGMVAD